MYESVRIAARSYFDDGDIFIFFQDLKFPYASMLHAHDFYELEIVTEGSGEEFINGERSPKQRGSVTVSTLADYHSFEIREDMKIIDIMLTDRIIPDELTVRLFSKGCRRSVRLDEKKLRDTVRLCELLSSVRQYSGPVRDKLEKQLLKSVLLIIMSQLEEDGQPRAYEKSDDIDLAIRYIDLHFAESPTLAAVAKATGKSVNYFSKFFKRSTGLNYSDYLNTRKVECAEMLLRFSDMSVTSICFNCGFNSLSNFFRVFKDLKGMRPSDYRNKYR